MIRITLFVGISFIFFRCQSDTYEFDMDKAVKNLSLSKTSLTRFNYAGILNDPENIFSTPVLVDSGHDSVYIQDAIVKGAKCEISEEIKFLLTTVDHNRNYSLDPNDLIVISGVEDDSIMTVLNPLSVKGKNSILVKFDDQVLRVTVELKESKVAAEFSSSTLYDVVFPTSLDPFQMIDLVSDERYQLDALALDDINAVITSSTNCRPCVKQLTNYLSNGSSEDDLNVIYIFPENTTLASIDKYVQIVKSNESNIKFLKGDINAFRKRYGLLGLPDGILVDKNGGLVKNHFTLNNKKPI